MSKQAAVLFEKKTPHIGLVTLNRPKARNAINGEVAQLMDAIVKQTEADPDIRAIILTGAGEIAFSAGADLKMISQGRGMELRTEDGGFGGFVFQPKTKPWIAAVGGYALAGGLEFVLTCDMVVASDKAVFGLPEVTRGIIASAGGVFRLARILPKPVAMEIIASGERFSAERALQLGMINKLVPHDSLMEEAFNLAERIAANAPLAVQESLIIARQAYSLSDEQLIQLSAEANRRIYQTEDAKEGPRAFVEKRKPVWKGR
ncbi:MAG: enoyl-CoA hydratase-related protein [Bacteroidota bacterium]